MQRRSSQLNKHFLQLRKENLKKKMRTETRTMTTSSLPVQHFNQLDRQANWELVGSAVYLGWPVPCRVTATARDANYCGPVTVPSSTRDRPPYRGQRPLLFTNRVWVLSRPTEFISAGVVRRSLRLSFLSQKTVESLIVCRCFYKGSTFSSAILRPRVLVRAGKMVKRFSKKKRLYAQRKQKEHNRPQTNHSSKS